MASYPRGVRTEPPKVPSDYASATGTHTSGGVAPSTAVRDPTCDLLLWKNPVETGKVFGLSLVVLLILKKVNLITFFLRVLYTVVFTTGAIEFASKVVLGQGIVSKYGLRQCPNVAGFIRPRMEDLLKHLPVYQTKLRTLVFAYEPKKNLQAGLVLYFLHKFFSWFSVWTIVFLGVISTFTLPLIYHTHQEEIDAAVNRALKIARAKGAEFSQIASEKSQPYLEKLDKKLGPVSKFVKTQYANANRAGAGAQTTSSAAPHASTAGLAAKVPIEKDTTTPSATGFEDQDAFVSGYAPSATTAASRGGVSSHSPSLGAATHEAAHHYGGVSSHSPSLGATTHDAAHHYGGVSSHSPSLGAATHEAAHHYGGSNPLQSNAQSYTSHLPSETLSTGDSASHHHLSDLNDQYKSHFGHDFSINDVQGAASKASEKTGHKLPDVPTTNPLSGGGDHDFSVDQLQNELKQNKDSLTKELNFNNH